MNTIRFGAMEAAQITQGAFVKDNTLGLTFRVMGSSLGSDINTTLRQPPHGKPDAKLKISGQTLEDDQFLLMGTVVKGPRDVLGKFLHHIVGTEKKDGKVTLPQLDLDVEA
jgi:hypothetical protein